jgi:hypothetical protein
MPLQNSGRISMFEIANEFKDSSPTSISEFYGRGMSLPSSGQISFSDFYGESNISGGTITQSGDYMFHTFTTSGTFNTNSTNISSIDYLIVGGGGGGGGGSSLGGGGGAGGFLSGTLTNQNGAFSITVGPGGGIRTSNRGAGYNGGNSSAFGMTAYGGGGGNGDDRGGLDGASGGGGGDSGGGGSAIYGSQGNNGGGSNDEGGSGGGGGAGGAGQHSSSGGRGGIPKQWSVDGQWYAEGGHGGLRTCTRTTSSYNLGGYGYNPSSCSGTYRDGVANTGSGGGGGIYYWGGQGSSGGSGIVKIRYNINSVGTTAPTAYGPIGAYTSLSVTNVDIGTASTNRVVLISHASRYGGSLSGTITAGGTTHSLNVIGGNGSSIGQETHCLLWANVPNGDVANISLSNSGGSDDRWSLCTFSPNSVTPTQTWDDSSGSLSITKSTTANQSVMAIGFAAYGSADIGGMTSDIQLDNNTRGLGGATAVGIATGTSHTFNATGYNITAAFWA